MKTKYTWATLCLLATLCATAQNATDSAARPRFKVSANYNSNLHLYGRTDSRQSSAFFPMAELWLTPDFYANAAPIFVNNAAQRFDYAGTVATVGYQHVSAKWITGVYVSKPFYKESSDLVQSALKAQAGATVSFLNNYLNLTLGGDAKYSNRWDAGATAAIDHLIRVANAKGGVWVFDPSLTAYAGTQNFTRRYTQKTTGGNLLFPIPREQAVTEQTTRFSLLSYEASVPVIYFKGPWTFVASPAYVVPQNLITVQGRPDLSEQGRNLFYATLTAKYSL